MSTRDSLDRILRVLPEEKIRAILGFAESLRDEHADWQQFGQLQLAAAYGQDEPEYTLADLKTENPQ